MDFGNVNNVINTLGLKNLELGCYTNNIGEISLYSNDLQYGVLDLLELLVELKHTYGLSKQSIYDLIGNFTINNILIQVEKGNKNVKQKGSEHDV